MSDSLRDFLSDSLSDCANCGIPANVSHMTAQAFTVVVLSDCLP